MRAFLTCLATFALGAAIALAPCASAQVKISSLPPASALAGGELLPAVQGGVDVVVTPAQIKTFTSGGGGGTPGGSSGQLQYDNGGVFGGFTLAGDCTIAVPTITCLGANGVAFGTFATQNYATPPAIGGTTPAAGSFSSLNDGALTASANVCTDASKILTSACTNEVAIANLAQIGANTVLGNGAGSAGNVTALATTGSGSVVEATSPTLVTPALGTPSALVLTNATGLPNASVVGLGTAALLNTGTSGATIPLLNVANTWGATQTAPITISSGGRLTLGARMASISTVPTIAAANFQTSGSPTVSGSNSMSFLVTLTATASASGTITFAAGATTGWNCFGSDRTTASIGFQETSTTTTTAVFTVTGSPGASDVYQFVCAGY